MGLAPIDGHLVAAEHAAAVVAPPYDSLEPEQRAAIVDAEPDRFLRVLPVRDTDADGLAGNRAALDRLLRTGRFTPLPGPSLVVLSLREGDRHVVAVVGDLPAGDYLTGRIRPHEQVRDGRVEELVRHLEVVAMASSPVCVVHPPDPGVTAATEAVRARPPSLEVALADGAGLAVWVVDAADEQARLADAVAAAGPLTVADGHHRAAAAARHGGEQGRVLTAAVPADHLGVEAFHRRIDGLTGVTVDRAIEALTEAGLAPQALPGAAPPHRGRAHVVIDGRWFACELPIPAGTDTLGALDVSVAEGAVIAPLLALGSEPDLVGVLPVAAPSGLGALTRPDSVGVALHPPSIEELLAVAAAGSTMPRKSTYLVPKFRSGVLVVPR